MAPSAAAPRVLALIEARVESEADPATPRFEADEPRVVDTPFGRLDARHPLRRTIRAIEYPASTERVLAAARASREVGEEQARWLGSVLPAELEFASEEEVVTAVGAWGPPPPADTRSL